MENYYDIVVYHGGCPDGIASAWTFLRHNPDAKFFGAKHNEHLSFDGFGGKKVAILDFSFTKERMEELKRMCKYVLLLDHHISAIRALGGTENVLFHEETENSIFIIDQKHAGAQLAWDYYEINLKGFYPWFIEAIADRDLWKWEMAYSKEINEALHYNDKISFEGLQSIYGIPVRQTYIDQGKLLVGIKKKEVEKIARMGVLCDFFHNDTHYVVNCVTCSPHIRSEVGHELSRNENCDFSMTYKYDLTNDDWWVSLRGKDDSDLDLSKIAASFGGGGHAKACGFTIKGCDGLKKNFSPIRD